MLKKEFSLHRPVMIFQPTENSRAAIIKTSSVRTALVSWEKCAVTKYLRICRCLWRGLGGGGSTVWLLNKSLTFKGPEA